MTDKERAERLRKVATAPTLTIEGRQALVEVADELDPPRPEPGTVVWWTDDEGLGDPVLGQIDAYGHIELFGTTDTVIARDVKWWPACIAGPMQEIVGIPPVKDWPEDSETLITLFEGEKRAHRHRDVITRAEAARRETEG